MAKPAPIPEPQSIRKKHAKLGSIVRIPGLLFQPQQLSIGQQIYCGYGIALGIAVTGVVVGLIVGDRVQKSAQETLRVSTHQTSLMSRLLLISTQFQPQREFIAVRRNAKRLAKAKTDFEERVESVEQLLEDISQSTTPSTTNTTLTFLNAYQLIFAEYVTEQKRILDEVTIIHEQVFTNPEQSEWLERELNEFVVQPTAVRFFRYTNEIASLLDASNQRGMEAQVEFTKANGLRIQIIVGSMLFSVMLATVLAWITGQAIIHPIHRITHVAQTVAKTGNFEQRVSDITGQSEVAVLSGSLNQLIDWVDTYMKELKQAQSQLIHTEKMSSLGQMVAGIAHEINNPVSFIAGNLPHIHTYAEDLMAMIELYYASVPGPSPEIERHATEIDLDFLKEDFPKVLESMDLGVQRIRKIVLSLRNFSRLDESASKEIDIHEGIDNTLILLGNKLKEGINVIRKYGDLPLIECYPAQLNQVFMNLLSNAIDALLEDSDTKDKQITIQTQCQPETISIAIQDNGIGIPEELKKKLFDPFFTTKPVGKGTGLGLAISYKIIEQHAGQIELFSRENEGTTFTIAIPQKISANNMAKSDEISVERSANLRV